MTPLLMTLVIAATPQEVDALRKEALAAFQQGKVDKACPLYQRLAELAVDDGAARTAKASLEKFQAKCEVVAAAGSVAEEMVAAATKGYAQAVARHRAGALPLSEVVAWVHRLRTAELAAHPAQARAANASHLGRVVELQRTVDAAVASGVATPADATLMQYSVAEAKLWASGASDAAR